MKAWMNNQFTGMWPVGTAGVVVAENIAKACLLFEAKLAEIGLSQPVDQNDLSEIDMSKPSVTILCDGDY